MNLKQPASPKQRCERCHNYLVICGHDEPFTERAKKVNVDKASLKVRPKRA